MYLIQRVFIFFHLQQLLEKAEARERERQKAEEKKVRMVAYTLIAVQTCNT
jgi:hypothetical protein